MPAAPFSVLALPEVPRSLASAQDLMGALDPLLLEFQWPSWERREPGQVRLGLAGNRLHVLAMLPDAHVVSLADGPNQRMWLLGDTFEMFLLPQERDVHGKASEAYHELHVTPQNHRLHLRIPSEKFFRARREHDAFEEFLLPKPAFESEAATEKPGWWIWAAVPVEQIFGRCGETRGQCWKYSFCRYDYDALPGEPVLSSTSPHPEADFHRTADWRVLRFE